MAPGDLLVIEVAGGEAAVENADEADAGGWRGA
jgi:hypothetical protein